MGMYRSIRLIVYVLIFVGSNIAINENVAFAIETSLKTVKIDWIDNIKRENVIATDDRELAIAQAKFELAEAANGRLENWIGAFGILITALLATFGFLTYRAAANAARAEISSMRDQMTDLKKQSEELVSAIGNKHGEAEVRVKQLDDIFNSLPKIESKNIPFIDQSSKDAIKIPVLLSEEQESKLDLLIIQAEAVPARDRSPNDFKILMTKAKQDSDWSKYLTLAESMAYFFEHDSDNLSYALFSKAFGYQESGSPQLAAKSYEEYLTRCQNDSKKDRVMAYLNWGYAIVQSAKMSSSREYEFLYRQAFVKFQEALKIDIYNHQAFYDWGNALMTYAKMKNPQEAKKSYTSAAKKFESALRLQPNNIKYINNLGLSLMEIAKLNVNKHVISKYYGLAEQKFEEALSISNDPIVLNNLGYLYLYVGIAKLKLNEAEMFEKTFNCYQLAIDSDSNHVMTLVNWSTALLKKAEKLAQGSRYEIIDEAESLIIKLERIIPGRGAYNWACVFGLRGNSDMAAKKIITAKRANFYCPTCSDIKSDLSLKYVLNTEIFEKALIEIGC